MLLSERIQEHVQQLPDSFKAEVLDFVEYLVAKAEREATQESKRDWSDFSLSMAMRGMEKEHIPLYTKSDLKVVFS